VAGSSSSLVKDRGAQTTVMKNQRRSSGKQLSPEQELRYFKAVVRSLMIDASKVLADIELLSH
jgi:hypothetical protein